MEQELTPRQIVAELDRYIVGQEEAKKAVAIALRNRWRRLRVPGDLQQEIMPNNIIMIGSTGIGKTEIARRLSNLVRAPFIKVEASKFTEVGYVGRDVESIIRDLADASYNMVRAEHEKKVHAKARERAEERLLDLLLPMPSTGMHSEEAQERYERTREAFRRRLAAGDFEKREVELQVEATAAPMMQVFGPLGMEDLGLNLEDMLRNALPKRQKTSRVTVAEARKILIQEEVEKLLDRERIKQEAVRRAEEAGIVFLDEIDKIAGNGSTSGPDVSREGVQRDILPIVEGTTVKTKYGVIRTDHILFIAAGAFHVSKPSDLIPELQGRFPIRVELSTLTEEDFVRILTQPRSALIKQYKALVEAEGAKLEFTKEAIREIAHVAYEVNERVENIGARRLHTIMSRLLEDVLFRLPDPELKEIRVTKRMVQNTFREYINDQDLSRYIL